MPGFHLLFPQGGLTALQARRPAVPIEALDFVVAGTGPEEAAVRTGREALAPCLEPARKTGLGGVAAREWLARAGHLATLQIRAVEGGWPYAVVDGGPLRLVKRHRWSTDDPPVDPGALCRSVTTDDECWIFTCECSDRYCGGIHSGILVAHDQGLVVWRSPEFPEVPLAVFGQQPYREAALAGMAALLRNPPRSGGLDWTTGTSPEWLRKALEDALAGRHWW